ncbi:MAG: hypothetical protein KDC06_12015 [Chitinophagaceae bacterium]|nr:hypothetical protein [Chitinophagaceae bacterium]
MFIVEILVWGYERENILICGETKCKADGEIFSREDFLKKLAVVVKRWHCCLFNRIKGIRSFVAQIACIHILLNECGIIVCF